VQAKGFMRVSKLTGSKLEVAFKQVLRFLLAFCYCFNPEFQFEKSLRPLGHPLLKCPACMTIEDDRG
jgi:hypothetical protein